MDYFISKYFLDKPRIEQDHGSKNYVLQNSKFLKYVKRKPLKIHEKGF